MDKPKYHLVSLSGGKDSTAMLLRMMELGYQINEVLFCDTGMEFPAMLRHIERVRAVVESAGIKFTTLRGERSFEYLMSEHVAKRRKGSAEKGLGYSWPDHLNRWCTLYLKTQVIAEYKRALRDCYSIIEYVGIAADEQYRLDRKTNQAEDKRHPLVDWGWSEADALAYCYANGYDWEGLYEHFKRVSCWCCPLSNLDELRILRKCYPELWQKLGELDAQTWRTFRPGGWSVARLDKRFALEEALTENGYPIKGKKFHSDLRRHCFEGVSIETIMGKRKQ